MAGRLAQHYDLSENSKVLDVGCGKGFLVKDPLSSSLNIDAYGLDISCSAAENCPEEVIGRLLPWKCCRSLPFPENSFDLVVSFNTIHNLRREDAVTALSEMQRSPKANVLFRLIAMSLLRSGTYS